MIRTLRKKFIIIAMSAIIVCTTMLVLSINLVNYVQMDREVSAIVSRIAENNGHFPGNMTEEGKEFQMDETRMGPDPRIRQTRELENETRFFVVHYGKSGEVFADTAKVRRVAPNRQATLCARYCWLKSPCPHAWRTGRYQQGRRPAHTRGA